MKRSTRSGVEDRWHRDPRKGEQVPFPADNPGPGCWCLDTRHGEPGKIVTTARHGQGKRWLARWVDHDGNEASKAFDRRAEAERHIRSVVTSLETGTYANPRRSGETFGTVAEAWHKTKVGRAPKTVAGYRGLLDVVILPKWQNERLRDIDHEALQTWITWLSTDPAARQHKRKSAPDAGLSPARVIQTHQVVHQVFAYAVRAKYLPANAADNITLPSKPESNELALTHNQVRALAVETAAAEVRQRSDTRPSRTSLAAMVRFLAYSGIRFGEAAALRVGDVDLEKRRVNISKGITGVRGLGRIEGDTKTHQKRSVPILTSECVEELRRATEGREPSEFLFPGPDGQAMTVGWFRVRFDKAVAKLNLGDVTPHTLRHTAGSLALSEGASVVTVQKLLGHRNATTTMNVYSHMLPDDFDNLAAAMEKAVQPT
ncbi:site-specific integrase [Mycobacterium sp. 852013-50091_SCH5140682]|uniref:tyrosine-type recombinase/integrase n=1 Tax=Mycobacterium sp. 852013-50091_SCH5140682 TaxID=1834109 RepID=UPI001E59297E|nr:site-specific integrase [Mycobacterium sp. 852013-50091_SCH5140682]